MKSEHVSSHQPHLIVFEGYQYDASKPWGTRLWHRFLNRISLDSFWNYLANMAAGSSEPIIRKRCDRQGQTFYAVYDPVTHHRTICNSEAEVRAWLEQRYYQ